MGDGPGFIMFNVNLETVDNENPGNGPGNSNFTFVMVNPGIYR